MDEKNQERLFARFNDCRKTFIISINSITILSLFVLITTFIPYTSYVANLLEIRYRQIKIMNENQLTFQERHANFDLVELEENWLQIHEPSVNPNTLSGNSKFKTPLGDFSVNNAELVLVYPFILSVLIIYLYFSMYNLYDLRKAVSKECNIQDNDKILQIPMARIILSWLLLYGCFTISVTALSVSVPRKPFQYDNQEKSFRLGQVIVQETHFQISRKLDRWIIIPSSLAVIVSPLTYIIFYLKNKN